MGQQLASIPTGDIGLLQEINQLREQVNKLSQQPIQFMQQNILPPLNQQFQQPIQTGNMGCHKCGEKGHKKAQYTYKGKYESCGTNGHKAVVCRPCLKCNKGGHNPNNCWKEKICKKCNTKGHSTEKCRKKDTVQIQTVNSIP